MEQPVLPVDVAPLQGQPLLGPKAGARPLDDPIVVAHPEYFLGLYRLESVDTAK